MAGLLEALHAFAGVDIDVPAGQIGVEPQLPEAWPELVMRKWYGETPFDLRATRQEGTMMLRISFPDRVPDAQIQLGLTLPAGRTAQSLDVRLDGVPQSPDWHCELVPGTIRTRTRVTLPASSEMEISVRTQLRRPGRRETTEALAG
jgi:hypothetical protein